jgi:Flp pilus assembly protein TadG
MRRRTQHEDGAAVVEFALIVPVLLLLVFGIGFFGRAYSVQIQLTGAAREGARVLAITNDWPAAQTAALASAQGMTPAPTITGSGACSPGDDATVTAMSTVPYQIPFWGTGTWTLEGIGVMRCGG